MNTFPIADLRRLIAVAAAKSERAKHDVYRDLIMARTEELLYLADHGGDDLRAAACYWRNDPVQQGHTLIPLLALCHGLDPGPGGRACMWVRIEEKGGNPAEGGSEPASGWMLWTADGGEEWLERGDEPPSPRSLVAAEPDDLTALVMACKLALQ